ncbi:MAG: hypothetical protein C0592_07930 [Marinilabiliales bacterium]|nr:MAG: hypothetical protein C0592_07930 [Marinilabiliales bacterium]
MKGFVATVLVLIVFQLNAQYAIGHRTITFNDPSRSRNIECEIYYPGATAGDDVACASGSFPVIIFGHGFSMGVDAYDNFADLLPTLGYVLVLPTTEGGLGPDHGDFGLDLRFLNEEIKSEATTNASFFLYGHFNGNTALAGHSMGGGSSFLAAENNSNITCLFNFAAAETTPSAVSAAANISVPVLVFEGEKDGVAPPASHQDLMYNALTTNCKYKIIILGGGHCYFANYNLACATGELFTTPQPTISREEQHDCQFDMLLYFLDWQLFGNASSKMILEDSLQNSPRVLATYSCPLTGIDKDGSQIYIYPNPASEELHVELTEMADFSIQISDMQGKVLFADQYKAKNALVLDVSEYASGMYILGVHGDDFQLIHTFVLE